MNRLTKEDISFLKELANEIKSQDRSCTRKPVYFTICENEFVTGIDIEYADDFCLVDEEGNILLTVGDAIQSISYHFDEDDDDELEQLNILKLCSDLDEVNEFCEDNNLDTYTYTGYKTQETHSEIFLTRSAYENHVKSNSHHYEDPICYTKHAWRNPQLEKLLEIVEKFSDTEEIKKENIINE